MELREHRPLWKTLLAFAIIYFVWGSTFFAIRVGVHEAPPLTYAALRFLVAGTALYGWLVVKGERQPTLRQWGSACILAALIFVCDYGLLFWAEQRVPSGIAAVVMATIPAFTALAEILLLKTQRLTVRLAVALLIGIGGVAALTSHSLKLGGAPVETAGAAALIVASATWSVASVMSRKLELPTSKGMSAAAQMLAGGVMLVVCSAAAGQIADFHPSTYSRGVWIALVYLIVAGSIVGFTAYVWLLHHESPTKVGTYAYVNPVVAVMVGYFLGGELLGLRTILGTLLVLVSVVLITTGSTQQKVAAVVAEESS